MRPIDRGECPKDATGADLVFAEYGHARPHLIKRIGDYCSFCEMRLPSPDVEHIRHKDGNPDLECAWTNFLLSCKSCNSTKATRVGTLPEVNAHLWPDRDRTFDAFTYGEGGVVRLAPHSDAATAQRARATATLVGLLKRPTSGLTLDQLKRASDRRYELRRDAWDQAIDAREDLQSCNTPQMRRQILKLAAASGFWSVWLTVFRNDSQMVDGLLAHPSFAGTATSRLLPLPQHATSAAPPSHLPP